MAGKVENKNLEEYENENYYLLWWSDKRHFTYYCLGLSDKDNSISRAANPGGWVLPYIGYIGMCGPKGYGFSALLVINRVPILADFGHFGHK